MASAWTSDPQTRGLARLRVGGAFGTDEAEKFVGALRSGFNVRTVQGEGGTTYLLAAA